MCHLYLENMNTFSLKKNRIQSAWTIQIIFLYIGDIYMIITAFFSIRESVSIDVFL